MRMHTPRISIIAAIGRNRELGKANTLIWHVREDLKRVKELTMGHPIIMGRKTYESIGHPLPGRTNIVITRHPTTITGCVVATSLEAALEAARSVDPGEIFIFGGASVYAEALPITDRLYLTLINAEDAAADVFFPEYTPFTKEVFREDHLDEDIPYSWVTLERV